MAKLSPTRRLLLLANLFNLMVAIYFIIIAIVGLAQLRWYHQLTVAVNTRYFITLASSYFAFFILILVGLILIGLFASSTLTLANQTTGHKQPAAELLAEEQENRAINAVDQSQKEHQQQQGNEHTGGSGPPSEVAGAARPLRVAWRQSSLSSESQTSVCCSIFLHLIASTGLILILVIWLYNTGELVRDSISGQLDYALARYQFSNRTNHLTVAVDGIQEINTCCGSLDYTDFPRQRGNGLSPSHYPGSCCGKHVFAAQVRAICMADEVVRSRRTNGCTAVLANHYDLISLLIVPVALVCLFVNITIIALITISRGSTLGLNHNHQNSPSTTTLANTSAASGRHRLRSQKL